MNTPILDATQAGSDLAEDCAACGYDLAQPIPAKRKDPVIKFKRFLTSLLLEAWQVENPGYVIFTTTFLPCKEEGFDAALYVTCGDVASFHDHNKMVDEMTELRDAHIKAMNDANPDVVTEPPEAPANALSGNVVEPGVTVGEPEDYLSPPDSATPVVEKEPLKSVKTKKKNA